MANQRNQNNLAALQESLSGVDSFYVVNYQGLTAGQLSRLRKDLVAKGGRMIVAKNTLINLALQGQERDFSDILSGPSAIVIAQDDPAGVAKILSDASRGNDKGIPASKGGYLEGRKIDVAVITRLANLGSKDQLYAELVGVLGAHLSNFVGLLEALQEQKSGEAA
ncbi:50S ribosomal protein L10 [Deinococcus peraridilitoris]|uniref:Large ribosomal subunit protein uL10 n=1 Tax=Deinococcus peraridilitoris (strain DSM 19664 / LMG 22246 / CIP 109416 / KR-200) TaxID=937777 RepID=K9ZZB9_DEIPD|nr:50S ribosomal protein L10 [Deinococcus peraridilitoris]AFZ66544.1 ribosomal protein L10 [Deinococcus peraridilitoris DSM 19664]